uniref:Dopamine receptor D4a n=1 Tax=Nothobranchius furzeri TaxID=105023 RepID=A0A8C6PET4_NOTFU
TRARTHALADGLDGGAAAEMSVNVSAEAEAAGRNVPALLFGVLLIVVITCGNVLVCLSVLTEKALKTTTNYFIVSLAMFSFRTSSRPCLTQLSVEASSGC